MLRCARKVMPSMASPLHGSGRGGRPCLGGSCFVGVGVRRARGELHGGMLADGPPHLPVGVLGGNRAAPPPRVPVASSGLWVSTLGSTQKQALQANGRGGGNTMPNRAGGLGSRVPGGGVGEGPRQPLVQGICVRLEALLLLVTSSALSILVPARSAC